MLSQTNQEMKKIAIIGSGITGLSVAFQQPPKTSITMFDKSRRPGGRVSTRVSRQHPGYSFDHGTPFVYAKGQFLQHLQRIDAVKEVKAVILDGLDLKKEKTSEKMLLGGNPTIQSIPIKLAEEIKIKHHLTQQYDTRINTIQEKGGQGPNLTLLSDQNRQYGPFDQVYVCIPYPQCRALKQRLVKLSEEDQNKQFYTCTWVVMIAFGKNSIVSKNYFGVDVCRNIGEDIESMVNQRSKGNKSEDDLWVFTMNEKWCKQNINLTPENVQQRFKQKIQKIFGKDTDIKFMKAHRWLYSTPIETPNEPLIGKNIVFGGDWVGKRKNVQEAWQLGPILYKAMNQKLGSL